MPGYALVEKEVILKKDTRVPRKDEGGTLTFTEKNYKNYRLVKRED
jgi:hypothetical protein